MAQITTYTMRFRRRREGKTDYKKRLRLLMSRKDRLVIRVLSKQVIVQVIGFDTKGDQVKATATSLELKKYGWKGHRGNVCAAYLTGLLCGVKAKKKGVKEAVPDIGLHTPVKGSNAFAALKGAVDAGLNVPHSKECFPAEDKINGKTLSDYRKKDFTKEFAAAKEKILK